MRHRLPLAAAAAAGTYALVHPHLVSWGATDSELHDVYPGDEIIPEADGESTFATTLPAPPEEVCPWLVQMGADRAGWYSFDRLDNAGRPSAEEIHPEWQDVHEGDRLLTSESGRSWFLVARMVPERLLVLRAPMSLDGRPYDPAGPPPPRYSDSIWAFHLRPAPGGGTRLIIRSRSRGRPKLLTQLAALLFWEPAHWVMQLRQFAGLERRVTDVP